MLNRPRDLKQIQHCLNTPEGEILMAELAAYADGPLLASTPQATAYRLGAFELYRHIQRLKAGELHVQ